jgi:hypothetical protein
MSLLKQIAARLPNRWQTELKRIYFGRQIRKGTFVTDEPEYKILHNLITSGDWVVDIGAEAHLSSAADSALSVLTLPFDSLCMNQHIALVKIDAEGHESFVLAGMQRLLGKYHPILIVETGSQEVIDNLSSLGYVPEKLKNSPNVLFKPNV